MKYIIKRLIESFITVLIIISVVFVLMRFLPAEKYFSDDELKVMTTDQVQTILKAEGLLDNPIVQLFRYYKQLLHFDLGDSRRIKVGVPVTELIGDRFLVSLRFGVVALLISYAVGILFGAIQAQHKDRILDHIGLGFTVFVNAVPGLVTYSLILFFGSKYLKLPSLYSASNPIMSAIMPVLCLSLGGIAARMLWLRRYMVDELNKDYLKLATMKGLTRWQVLFRHTLKNAFVPMSQQLPTAFLTTISGSLLVERFFSVPGIGYLLTDAIAVYDYNVVQALVMLYAFLGVMGVFLGDLLLTAFDPRVRLGKKEVSR